MNLRNDAIEQVAQSCDSGTALGGLKPEPQDAGHDDGQKLPPSLKQDTAKLLSIDYIPSPNSVLTGRGKFCAEAIGSKRLRAIASSFLDQYSKAETKHEKSGVVSKIIEIVEERCPEGGAFVKLEKGRWWEVDKSAAREKVGYVLRNLLHDQYRSSSKSKAKTRRLRQSKMAREMRFGLEAASAFSSTSPESSGHPPLSKVEIQRLTRGDTASIFDNPHKEDYARTIKGNAAIGAVPSFLRDDGSHNFRNLGREMIRFPVGNDVVMPEDSLLSSRAWTSRAMMIADPRVVTSAFPPVAATSLAAPQTHNLSRAQTWPRVNMPGATAGIPPLPSETRLPHSAQTAQLPLRAESEHSTFQGGRSWQSPPFASRPAPRVQRMEHLEEALKAVTGDSTPIDANELSNIFD